MLDLDMCSLLRAHRPLPRIPLYDGGVLWLTRGRLASMEFELFIALPEIHSHFNLNLRKIILPPYL